MKSKQSILIVDDEDSIRKLLQSRFEREGYTIVTASNAEDASKTLASDSTIAVVVTDVRMPGKDGLTFLKEEKPNYPDRKFMVMTGHGEKSTAVQSLKNGASDYLEKPFDMDEMTHSVKRAMREFELEKRFAENVEVLKVRATRAEEKSTSDQWINPESAAMKPVMEWMHVLRRESMKMDSPEPNVLIQGDSGTGKEEVARLIHRQSKRGNGAWIAVNCANFNENMLESELFGHEKGSFTGATGIKRGLIELSSGGTLFLDEIGEMDPKLQSRLLRVVQEKKFRRVGGNDELDVDLRVIAATNRNLNKQIETGQFREDLYHRLSGVVIQLPSLKSRTEDLIPMAKQFLARSFQARGKKFDGLTPTAEEALLNHTWPGNVRELAAVAERTSLIWNRQGAVDSTDLSFHTRQPSALRVVNDLDVKVPFDSNSDLSFTSMKKTFADQFERQFLERTLERHRGNVSAAAKESKLDRSNFLRLLRRHGLRADPFRKTEKAA